MLKSTDDQTQHMTGVIIDRAETPSLNNSSGFTFVHIAVESPDGRRIVFSRGINWCAFMTELALAKVGDTVTIAYNTKAQNGLVTLEAFEINWEARRTDLNSRSSEFSAGFMAGLRTAQNICQGEAELADPTAVSQTLNELTTAVYPGR